MTIARLLLLLLLASPSWSQTTKPASSDELLSWQYIEALLWDFAKDEEVVLSNSRAMTVRKSEVLEGYKVIGYLSASWDPLDGRLTLSSKLVGYLPDGGSEIIRQKTRTLISPHADAGITRGAFFDLAEDAWARE